MIYISEFDLRYWFITGILFIVIGSTMNIFSLFNPFEALLILVGGILSFIYVPIKVLLQTTSTKISTKIIYLHENHLISNHQHSTLAKATRYIQLVAFLNAFLGTVFILSGIGMFSFLYDDINTLYQLNIIYLNIPLILIAFLRYIFVYVFALSLLLGVGYFPIKLDIIYMYVFLYGVALFLLGLLLLYYNEHVRRINLILSTLLIVFFPLGTGISIFELYILTHPRFDILFNNSKFSKEPSSDIFIASSKEIKGVPSKEIIIKHIYILNIIVLAVYGVVALNYLFSPKDYYADFVSILYNILGLIIICIIGIFFIINCRLYKYKRLSIKSIVFITIIQFALIPIFIVIEFLSFNDPEIKLLITVGLLGIYLLATISSKKLIDVSTSIIT